MIFFSRDVFFNKYILIVLPFFQNRHFGRGAWNSDWEGVSGQFQTNFRPLLGLALGYLSFQYLLRALDFQNGRFRKQKSQGKLRKRKLIRRKASLISCFGNQKPQDKLRECKLMPRKENVTKKVCRQPSCNIGYRTWFPKRLFWKSKTPREIKRT